MFRTVTANVEVRRGGGAAATEYDGLTARNHHPQKGDRDYVTRRTYYPAGQLQAKS